MYITSTYRPSFRGGTSTPTFNQFRVLHKLHAMLGTTNAEALHVKFPLAWYKTRMLDCQRYSSVTTSNYTATLHGRKPLPPLPRTKTLGWEELEPISTTRRRQWRHRKRYTNEWLHNSLDECKRYQANEKRFSLQGMLRVWGGGRARNFFPVSKDKQAGQAKCQKLTMERQGAPERNAYLDTPPPPTRYSRQRERSFTSQIIINGMNQTPIRTATRSENFISMLRATRYSFCTPFSCGSGGERGRLPMKMSAGQ